MLARFLSTLVFPAGHGVLGRWQRLRSRHLAGVDPKRFSHRPWLDLARLAAARLDRSGVTADRLWEWTDRDFARHAARTMGDVSAVMGYEHASLELFTAAKARGIRSIYAAASAHSPWVQSLVAEERRRLPEADDRYALHTRRIEGRRQARRDAEYATADLVLAHSRFVEDSFSRAGFDTAKILRIPLGAPPPAKGERRDSADPVFLFAGNFALHKGVLVLWEAWRLLAEPRARLLVAGAVQMPDAAMRHSPPGIEYLGKLPWDGLQDLYRRCRALVFPTLADGFGMVVTEAMAQGLPVITTTHAGASDLISDGQEGFIVPARDAAALAAAMRTLAGDRGLAQAMGERARAAATVWQWSDYRAALVQGLKDRLDVR